MDNQHDTLHPEQRFHQRHLVEIRYSGCGHIQNQVENNGEDQIPIEHRGIVEMIRVFLLDQRGTKSALDEDVGNGEENGQHSDAAEVLRHQKACQHKVGEEVDGQRPHLPHGTPHHAENRLVLQVALTHTLFNAVVFPIFYSGAKIRFFTVTYWKMTIFASCEYLSEKCCFSAIYCQKPN